MVESGNSGSSACAHAHHSIAEDSYPGSVEQDMLEKAAIASPNQGEEMKETTLENKSADAWHSFFAALINSKSLSKSSSTASSTATPAASLSEEGSSHGAASPCPAVGDDGEAQGVGASAGDATGISTIVKLGSMVEVDVAEGSEAESVESGVALSSKRSRRSNRRRRTRRSRREGGKDSITDPEGCGAGFDEATFVSGGTSSCKGRDVVVLSDLCLGLDSPAVCGVNQPLAKQPPAQADFPGSPCRGGLAQAGITSTSVSSIGTNRATTGDASARALKPSPLLITSHEVAWGDPLSPCCARASPCGIISTAPYTSAGQSAGEVAHVPPTGGAQAASIPANIRELHARELTSQASPCMGSTKALAGDASSRAPTSSAVLITAQETAWADQPSPCRARTSPSGIMSTAPYTAVAQSAGEASSRTPLPVGAQMPSEPARPTESHAQELPPKAMSFTTEGAHNFVGSPCHAWTAPTGGIVSTSPVARPMGEAGPLPSFGTAAFAGAGSQSADTLRSWLHASGLPSAADLVAQLHAAAPEMYED